jgi:pilus assembly protein CpaB
MVLILSIIMGIVTTVLFFQYMKQFNTQKAATVRTVEVVVAKERIDKNEKISSKKLEMVQMPAKNVLPETIKSFTEAEGKMASSVLEKGEPILSHHLVSEQEEGVYVSRKVREGFRAISVGVNLNQSVTNLIEPEDQVDVVSTKITKDASNQVQSQSSILLKKVRVLAVGRQMLTPENTKEPYKEFSSVTLEVKPEDSIKLIDATQQGIINLILNKRPLMNEENQINQNQ